MVVLHHPPTGHSTSPSHHPLRAPILSYQTNFHLSLPTHQMSPWKACITSPQATEPSLNTTNSSTLYHSYSIISPKSPTRSPQHHPHSTATHASDKPAFVSNKPTSQSTSLSSLHHPHTALIHASRQLAYTTSPYQPLHHPWAGCGHGCSAYK